MKKILSILSILFLSVQVFAQTTVTLVIKRPKVSFTHASTNTADSLHINTGAAFGFTSDTTLTVGAQDTLVFMDDGTIRFKLLLSDIPLDNEVLTFDLATGIASWEVAPGSGGGEVNILGDMPGTGIGLSGTKTGFTLRVNRIYGSGGITVADSTDSLNIFIGFPSLSSGTIVGADTLIFKDVTDGVTKKGLASDIGGANHEILSPTHSDAGTATVVRGDLIVGLTATPAWNRLALGAAGTLLRSDGTDLLYTTATYPATTTASQLLYSSGTNVVAGLTTANNGVLITGATGIPSISSTLPTATQANITGLGIVTSGTVQDGVIPNNITIDLSAAATALAANGANAAAGNAILGVDASGAAEGAFDVWTEAENTSAAYLPRATFADSLRNGFRTGASSAAPASGDTLLALIGGVINRIDIGNLPGVTVSGVPDYITLSGQDIVRGLIVLTTDVSGALPYANMSFSNNIVAGDIATGAVATAEILDGTLLEADLNSTNAPTDNFVLSYNAAGLNYTWAADQTAGSPTWDTIGDAAGNGTIDFADTEQIITLSQTSGDVTGLTLDINQVDDAAATDDLIAFSIDATSESGDAADTFRLARFLYENGVANAILDAGILIDNAETTASTMTDALIVTSSGVNGGVVDAIDVSAANITNAINIGSNDFITTASTLSSTELDRLDGLLSAIIENNSIDTYSELDAIVTDVTLSHSTLTETLTNKLVDDFSNEIDADRIHVNVRNSSGATINRGDVVYISGFNVGQNLPEVALADASSAATMSAFLGMVEAASIANNANGEIAAGRIPNFNTSAFSVGDLLYVSETGTTGNTLTTTKPTGAALIRKVGIVLRSHATLGVVEVGAGFSGGVPNIASANFWVGNGSGVPTAVLMSSEATMSNTGAVTLADGVTVNNWALGTPASMVGTNITGTAAGLTAGNVTTNANFTGPITSVGNATSIAAQTGTGTTFAMSVSPVFTGTNVNMGGGASATELRFLEPSGGGASYTGFKSPALAANLIYTMPTAFGSAGFQLTDAAGNGVLSWATSADTVEIQLPGVLFDTTSTTNGTLDFLETGAYRINYWEYAASTQDTLLLQCAIGFSLPQDFGSFIDAYFEYETEQTGADTLILRMEGIAHDEPHSADLTIGTAPDTLVAPTGPAANDKKDSTLQSTITGTFAAKDHIHLLLYRPATDAGVMRFFKLIFRYLKS